MDAGRSLLVTESLPPIGLREAVGGRSTPWPAEDYRLLAVVNRTDLSVVPDRAAEGGEGRLVFGHRSEARTIIVEYAQPGPAREWAARWQGLDGSSSALAALVSRFGPIAQIRTADATPGSIVLRQYAVTSDGVTEASLRNEPDYARVSAGVLATYATDHEKALREGTALMPRAWWATSAAVAPAPAGVPESVVAQTCSGCHAKTETGFHVDPRTGRATGFLSNPSASADELRRRATWMQLTLARP